MKKILFTLSFIFISFSCVLIFNNNVSAASLSSDSSNIFNGYVFALDTSLKEENKTYSVYMIVYDYLKRNENDTYRLSSINGVYFGTSSYMGSTYDYYYFDIRFLPDYDLFDTTNYLYEYYFGVLVDNRIISQSTGNFNYYAGLSMTELFSYVTPPDWAFGLDTVNVFYSDNTVSGSNLGYEWRLKNPSDVYDLYIDYCSSYYFFALDNANQQYSLGYTSGYSNGLIDGYNNGYDAGTQVGNLSSYQNGYNAAYDDYYVSRYDLGYNAGVLAGQSQNNWLAVGLLSLVDIPFMVFRNIFNFDLFGFNLYGIILTLATIGVVLWLLKKFFKKD